MTNLRIKRNEGLMNKGLIDEVDYCAFNLTDVETADDAKELLANASEVQLSIYRALLHHFPRTEKGWSRLASTESERGLESTSRLTCAETDDLSRLPCQAHRKTVELVRAALPDQSKSREDNKEN